MVVVNDESFAKGLGGVEMKLIRRESSVLCCRLTVDALFRGGEWRANFGDRSRQENPRP